MTSDWLEYAARQFDAENIKYPTPGDLAKALDPATVQTPALDLIDQALVDIENGDCDRLILSLPPQEGKSSRVTTIGPLWFLLNNPDRRLAVVSYGADLADEFGRAVRNMVQENQGEDGSLDLGLRIASDNGSIRKWSLAGHKGGMRSVGLTGGITGRPVDGLIIDDPISNMEQAMSPAYRERAWRFWTAAGRTRLGPGAFVIVILTRWHHSDLAGRLMDAPDGDRWRVINIPARANHRPELGETDPLGREPGEYLLSARMYDDGKGGLRHRTDEEWESIEVEVGPVVWNALYQGNPSPAEGGMFPQEWATYDEPLWINRDDGSRWIPGECEVIQSWDLAFKDTKNSDYVVGQVWARIGTDVYLVDQVRDRMSFTQTMNAIKGLSAKWPQSTAKFVEDKANGPAVINALSRELPGLIPIEPEGSKEARAAAVSPFTHSGNVKLPEARFAPWVEDFILEARGFPMAAHDDQIDAFSQAVNRLLLMPLQAETIVNPFDTDYGHDWSISPY
ncbi:MAG: phage terminase large subunit [Candidatus Nanopelagicales bacterium]